MITQTQVVNNFLNDESVPALLTKDEKRKLNFYKDKAYSARTSAEARIYNKRIEVLILRGKRRALNQNRARGPKK